MPTFTSGNDTFLVHTAGTFDLDFLEGDDTLTVQGGTSTTAHMGIGDDVVQLKSGLATVFGDAGADRFEIYAANAIVDAGDDNDLINIRGGSGISASGGLGADRFNIYAGSLNLTLHGGDGDDDFFGYFHPVTGTIYGDAGNDYFVQFIGGVSIYGGTGNDIYRADATNPATFVEISGEGTDSVQVARGASYTLPDNIENISVQGFHGSVLTAATLTGNALNNIINGHNNIETIFGLVGDDRLFAKGGDDTVWGGDGNDYLDGGPGNDTLNGENGNDTINGRAGNDTMAGGAGDDTYFVDSLGDLVTENSGEGTDLVRVSVSDFILPDNVENGIQSISSTPGLPTRLDGNTLDNDLTGGSANDWLLGWDGNDTLRGGAGNDILAGHSGNDILNGGTGDDQMVGGAGNDTYYVDSVNDTVDEDAIDGGAGIDTIISSLSTYSIADPGNTVLGNPVANGWQLENLTFNGSGGAALEGNASANIIHGGAGDDIIWSHNGADILYGGDGDDEIHGGNGDVAHGGIGLVIYGGNGNDFITWLTGAKPIIDPGLGADVIDATGQTVCTIVYSSVEDSPVPPDGSSEVTYDRMSGFADGIAPGDKIDLSAIDANTTVAGDQAFSWVLTPTGAAGEIWEVHNGIAAWTVYADVDGGGADFMIDFTSSDPSQANIIP